MNTQEEKFMARAMRSPFEAVHSIFKIAHTVSVIEARLQNKEQVDIKEFITALRIIMPSEVRFSSPRGPIALPLPLQKKPEEAKQRKKAQNKGNQFGGRQYKYTVHDDVMSAEPPPFFKSQYQQSAEYEQHHTDFQRMHEEMMKSIFKDMYKTNPFGKW